MIFDLDGTLIDSFECVFRCVNRALESFGLPHVDIPDSMRNGDIAVIFDEARKIITGVVPFAEFKQRFDEIHLCDSHESIRVIEPTAALARQFSDSGIHLIILTNKRADVAEKCMQYFFPDLHFILIGRTGVESLKSDCSKVKSALMNAGCDCRNVLGYYGDTMTDCNLARQLNVQFFKV